MRNFRLLEISEPKFPYRFQSSRDAYNAVKDYGRADREVFLALFLNSAGQLIDCEPVGVGNVKQTSVFPGEILRGALMRNASGVIVAHNHPGGGCTPSPEDIQITKQIALACAVAEVHLLDHLILGKDCYLSFVDSGRMPAVAEAVNKALEGIGLPNEETKP